MASILFWFFAVLGSIAGGFVLGLILFLFYRTIRTSMLKRKLSNLKKNPDYKKEMLDGGKPEKTEMEVEEDEQRKHQKYREYEKLRQLAGKSRGDAFASRESNDARKAPKPIRARIGDAERNIVPPYFDKQYSNDKRGAGKTNKRVTLDE